MAVAVLSDPDIPVHDRGISLEGVARELADAHPRQIIARALEVFGDQIAISFSGAEDVLLIEYAKQTQKAFRVFTLDTGRLPAETYRLFSKVEERYGISIEYYFPDTVAVESLVRRKGMFSFYRDGHAECCAVRKVKPLRRALSGLEAWITGQRRDQNPGTRSEVPVVHADNVFIGRDGASLAKWNPLAARTSAQVWNDIRAFDVPYNELHERGFISIGCEPCTRAVLPGQHEREGRWWWEHADKKECGLHEMNVGPDDRN